MTRPPRIVGFGGGALGPDGSGLPLLRYALDLAGVDRPRVLFLPTAAADADDLIVTFYERFAHLSVPSHLKLFGAPDVSEWRPRLLQQDVIYVSGGNTANALAIWRAHGVDAALREAWESGILLCGGSAGMICWFECSVTDSFGAALGPLRDGLGFLPGSACPHYHGEDRRRPIYHQLVASGFPGGYAVDDLAGVSFEGTTFREAVSASEGCGAYRVELVGGAVQETPIPTRALV